MKKVLVALVLALTPACAAPTPAQLAPAMVASTVALSLADGKVYCSGVAISATRVLTAAHCLGAPELYVFAEGGTPKEAKVIWKNVERDAAEIEVPGANFIPARIGDSDSVRRGDRVFAVGNSYGELTFSFAVGYVAFEKRVYSDLPGTFIQGNLEVRGGNSGGPLFDDAGEVIGIVVRADMKGIVFAVPINEAKQ